MSPLITEKNEFLLELNISNTHLTELNPETFGRLQTIIANDSRLGPVLDVSQNSDLKTLHLNNSPNLTSLLMTQSQRDSLQLEVTSDDIIEIVD